jgi:UDP-N-acetylglucosamine--N-acetylmuramyl-(pentapeptide) pyrophosphoryl-undecaprenol N-acetylglucosamine transferase
LERIMRFIIAGGGTGGHLFPGIAIAEAFLERERKNEGLFIGTERGIEARVLAGGKFPLKTIHAMPIKGRSMTGKVRALWNLPKAVLEAFSILKDFQPEIVLGVGGYASGPALVAAFFFGSRRAIHEQNVIPGMTNRMLKWFSNRVFVSFEETKRYFPVRKTVLTGNPVRREMAARLLQKQEAAGSEAGEPFTLFIFGGSAGARRINEAMMEALDHLRGEKASLRIIHQTGREDADRVSRRYQEEGFDASVKPFFEEMAANYRSADLVICRAGATTIAELAVAGKPAILIPYPFAAHGHQLLNAKKLEDLGAARMVSEDRLNGATLARAILHLATHREELRSLGEAIQRVGRPGAAREIVDHCYALVQGRG